jgi:hypothetical protein
MRADLLANEVSADDDDGVWALAFCASGASSCDDPYVLVQRSIEVAKQDIELEMDGVYVEYCSQSLSLYGHVKSVTLSPTRFRLQLDDEGAKMLNGISEIAVAFSVPAVKFEVVAEIASQMFHDLPFICETA